MRLRIDYICLWQYLCFQQYKQLKDTPYFSFLVSDLSPAIASLGTFPLHCPFYPICLNCESLLKKTPLLTSAIFLGLKQTLSFPFRSLGNNLLSGEIPDYFQQLSKLTKLYVLSSLSLILFPPLSVFHLRI